MRCRVRDWLNRLTVCFWQFHTLYTAVSHGYLEAKRCHTLEVLGSAKHQHQISRLLSSVMREIVKCSVCTFQCADQEPPKRISVL